LGLDTPTERQRRYNQEREYGNARGTAPATFYSQAGFSYPMQFFDVFNSTAGGGAYLPSKDLSQKAQRYFLSEDDSGATFYLGYPALYLTCRRGGRTAAPK
jgi:hypothetical protein